MRLSTENRRQTLSAACAGVSNVGTLGPHCAEG